MNDYILSGEIDIATNSPHFSAKLIWSSVGDPETNESTVTASVKLTLIQLELVDYSQLELLVNYYRNPKDYTESTFSIYLDKILLGSDALSAIYNYPNNHGYSQEDIDELTNEINISVDNLIRIVADTTELENLVNYVKANFNESDYSANSWEYLASDLSYAEGVLGEDFPLVSDVEYAIFYLNDSISALEPV